jgi:hypothetical protein
VTPRFLSRNFGPYRTWSERIRHRVVPSLRAMLVASDVANDRGFDPLGAA